MATVAEMVGELKDDFGLDESEAVLKRWLLDRIRRMFAASGWKRQKRQLGPTVIGQSEYDVPVDVTDVRSVWVNNVKFSQVTPEEMIDLQQRVGALSGASGAFAPEYGATGAEKLEIFPTPDVAGEDIIALASYVPADPADNAAPDFPPEFQHYALKGAAADGLQRTDERYDEAAALEAEFQQGIELLRQRRNSRIGSGPVQMRVPQY